MSKYCRHAAAVFWDSVHSCRYCTCVNLCEVCVFLFVCSRDSMPKELFEYNWVEISNVFHRYTKVPRIFILLGKGILFNCWWKVWWGFSCLSRYEQFQHYFMWHHMPLLCHNLAWCIDIMNSIVIYFCCAMLCKCSLCSHAVSVCVSVCVHHIRTFCQNELTYLQIFSPSGSYTILVFVYQTTWRYSDGNPPNGGVECRLDGQKSLSGFTACC